MPSFTNILVPTDFTESCRAAIDAAVDLAARFDASITLVHVWEVPPSVAVGLGTNAVELLMPMQEAARKQLDVEVQALKARAPTVASELRSGTVWEEILAVARERNADLIVIGTHGRTGLRHAVLGSVAEKVVRTSPVPVLTVRSASPDAASR
jgi:nucleotide-binding universal stress UspA family protein